MHSEYGSTLENWTTLLLKALCLQIQIALSVLEATALGAY